MFGLSLFRLTRQSNISTSGEESFKYPFPRENKIGQMPYLRDDKDNQIPTPCPASPPLPPPPRRHYIDRCIDLARQGSLLLCAPGDKKVRTLGTNLRSFELLLLYKETIFECQRTIIGVHKCMLQLLFPYFLTEYYPLSLPIFLIFLTHILDQSLADVNDKGKLSLSISPS